MAANNIGVPKRISAPNTIERVGIGDDGSDPSAPKPKNASPAFTFGGAGSNSASQHGRPKVRTTSQVQAIVTKIVDYDNKLPFDELEGVLRRRYNVTQEECSTTQLPVLVKRAKQGGVASFEDGGMKCEAECRDEMKKSQDATETHLQHVLSMRQERGHLQTLVEVWRERDEQMALRLTEASESDRLIKKQFLEAMTARLEVNNTVR